MLLAGQTKACTDMQDQAIRLWNTPYMTAWTANKLKLFNLVSTHRP